MCGTTSSTRIKINSQILNFYATMNCNIDIIILTLAYGSVNERGAASYFPIISKARKFWISVGESDMMIRASKSILE